MSYTVEFIQGFDENKINEIDSRFGIDEYEKKYIIEDYRNVMLVYHKQKPHFYITDYMEPEDANFNRDLSWIKDRLEEAYHLGFMDGKENL